MSHREAETEEAEERWPGEKKKKDGKVGRLDRVADSIPPACECEKDR